MLFLRILYDDPIVLFENKLEHMPSENLPEAASLSVFCVSLELLPCSNLIHVQAITELLANVPEKSRSVTGRRGITSWVREGV